ncbi:HopJ type III effector protein [Algoriphagus sp. D3-2-R+10]|uniref:HopJ type III effector protein n=1 Tax=Algoriphagus aurantiacus TaxID=3103948 RepID=UPI002B394DB1|nr:HopJ type III effector protein [Algoriphagus sp. D3-2-R+10]MEB2777756.1 HopJ type III effector protein [Algoriphagus sp. D3-2-R+10]
MFYFAKPHGLSPSETLVLFGDFHRKDVLENPDGSDHQNIRNFMQAGWEGIEFDGEVLVGK